jgi:uncharacterized YccA/Bax inhibitor family protein
LNQRFVIIIAALNLFLDFDRIEVEKNAEIYEMVGAMGLMITLVWFILNSCDFQNYPVKINLIVFIYISN